MTRNHLSKVNVVSKTVPLERHGLIGKSVSFQVGNALRSNPHSDSDLGCGPAWRRRKVAFFYSALTFLLLFVSRQKVRNQLEARRKYQEQRVALVYRKEKRSKINDMIWEVRKRIANCWPLTAKPWLLLTEHWLLLTSPQPPTGEDYYFKLNYNWWLTTKTTYDSSRSKKKDLL